jgi:peptidyl-prolyl cis-trans isomerase C
MARAVRARALLFFQPFVKLNSLLLAAFCAASPCAVTADSLPPAGKTILTNGTDGVTVRDFEAVLTKVPEHLRLEARASLERVASLVDEVYVNRVLAHEAVEQGIDRDPIVQVRMKQLQEAYLAALALEAIEKKALGVDLEARAREIYVVERARFREPEMAHVQIGMIDLECRTPQQTLSVSAEVAAKARKGEDLKSLIDAVRMSRDPGRRRFEVLAKRGDLEPELEAVVFEKLRPGEVSDPVEIRGGFAVVKLIEKRPARDLPFEAVRKKLLDEERSRVARLAVDNKNREIRTDPRLNLDRDLLLSLKTELEPVIDRGVGTAKRDHGKPD